MQPLILQLCIPAHQGFMFPSQGFIDQDFVEQKSAENILLPCEILSFSHVRYDFSMDSAMLPHSLRGAINPQWTIPLVCGPKKHHGCLQKLVNPLELPLMINTLSLVTSCVSELLCGSIAGRTIRVNNNN